MKSRCEWPSLPSRPLSRGTGAGVFTLLPVPQPQAPALLADPAGDLLAKLGALGGGDGGGAGEEPVSWGTPWGWAKLLQSRGLVRAVHHSAGHPSPFPASLPLDIKGTFPRAKETQNHFLPHLVPPSNLSLSHPSAWPHQHVWGCALSSHQSPQLPSALARVPSWKYSHQ